METLEKGGKEKNKREELRYEVSKGGSMKFKMQISSQPKDYHFLPLCKAKLSSLRRAKCPIPSELVI